MAGKPATRTAGRRVCQSLAGMTWNVVVPTTAKREAARGTPATGAGAKQKDKKIASPPY